MKINRICKHLLTSRGDVRRAFPPKTMAAIERVIKQSESAHVGEVCFVVEAALDVADLYRGLSARERAIEVFAQQRIWDTEDNCGLLIYLLMADRAVEIVADRGIHAKVPTAEWTRICRKMETCFKAGDYERGVTSGIQEVTQHLMRHFPAGTHTLNELADQPVIL